jgi:hypothetical protein
LSLLHLDVSKLDRVLHLPPRLSAVLPHYQAREDGGGPHWRRRASRACGRTQQARRGRASTRREMGVAVQAAGRAGNSHTLS